LYLASRTNSEGLVPSLTKRKLTKLNFKIVLKEKHP
jgi:hypothetical protein